MLASGKGLASIGWREIIILAELFNIDPLQHETTFKVDKNQKGIIPELNIFEN